MEVGSAVPTDEWVLLLSKTLVQTKAKLASSEFERERMKLRIRMLEKNQECTGVQQAQEIRAELEQTKKRLQMTQGALQSTNDKLRQQQTLVGRFKAQKSTMLKALAAEKGAGGGGSGGTIYEPVSIYGAESNPIAIPPRSADRAAAGGGSGSGMKGSSASRVGMWGAKYLQLSEAGWQPEFFGAARFTVGRSASARASFWPGGDEDYEDEDDVHDNNMSFGEIGGGGTHHSSSSSYKYNADDDDDGDGDGYTNLNRMEFIVDEERQSAEAPTQRPTDLLEINFAPGYWKGVGRYWTGKIRERPPRSQLWRRMQKATEAKRVRAKEVAALQYWLQSGGTARNMPSVLSSRSAYKPAYTAAPSSKKTGYSFNSYSDGGDDDDDDATAGSPPYHLGTSPADRKKKVFSSALQDIALSIRQALSTPKPSPDPSPARPSGTEGAAGGVVARTSTESEWLHSAEDLGDGGPLNSIDLHSPADVDFIKSSNLTVNGRGAKEAAARANLQPRSSSHRPSSQAVNLTGVRMTHRDMLAPPNYGERVAMPGVGADGAAGVAGSEAANAQTAGSAAASGGDDDGTAGELLPRSEHKAAAASSAKSESESAQCVSASASKRTRYFIALYDYLPSVSSPNLGYCGDTDELALKRGQVVKIVGDIGADGFYVGELLSGTMAGVRGVVPSNYVQQINASPTGNAPALMV